MPRPNPTQFSLSLLLFATTAITAVIACCTLRVRGELCRASEVVEIQFGSGASSSFVTELKDLDLVKAEFRVLDVKQCNMAAKDHFLETNSNDKHFSSATYTLICAEEQPAFKIDYNEWGRYRFDIRQQRMVFDTNDPIATRRNYAILRAHAAALDQRIKIQQKDQFDFNESLYQ